MSRRTHALVALVATSVLVALLAVWYATDRPPVESSAEPTPGPGSSTATPTSRLPSASVPTSAVVVPSGGTPTPDVPGSTITPCDRTGAEVPLTVATFNIHSAVGQAGF